MNATCIECGTCTPVANSFREVRRAFQSRTVFYCPRCWNKRQWRRLIGSLLAISIIIAMARAARTVILLGGEGFDLGYWAHVGTTLSGFVLNLAFLYVFLIVLVLAHELGHAVGAWTVGWRVFKISLGFGRTLGRFRLAGLVFEINLSTVGGLTWTAPKTLSFARSKYSLMVLAGPCVNALALAGLIAALSWDKLLLGPWNQQPAPVATLGFANLIILVATMLPHKVSVTCGSIATVVPSDGLALLTAPFLSTSAVEQWHAFYFLGEGNDCWERRDYTACKNWYERGLALYPADIGCRIGLGLALSFLRDLRGGREQWDSVLQREDLPAPIRPMMLNNVAWADLMIHDAELLDEADRYSQLALEQNPTYPPFQGTRGSVLIERGDIEHGLFLVQQALKGNDDPRLKALNAAYLALGEAKRGNLDVAKNHLEATRRFDRDCMLLDRVESQIGTAPPAAEGPSS
jgi:tetratricopeptide (TPR) repeat protein